MSLVSERQVKWRDGVVLLILLFLATGLRWDFLAASNFRVDSDEAIVGLMAQDISQGATVPVFYYGQHYMGSLEAMLVSALYSLAGFHPAWIKVVPLVFSLLFILVVYFIGVQLAGRLAGIVSATLCAIGPGTLLVWSTKARGGFIEIVFFAALAVLLTIYWLRDERPDWTRLGIIAVILGFGWWTNNQIVYVYLPIAFAVFWKLWHQNESYHEKAKTLGWSFLGCTILAILGGLPFWLYNLQNQFASFAQLFRGGEVQYGSHIRGFIENSLPILLGAKQYWHTEELFSGSLFLLFIIFLITIVFLWYGIRKGTVARDAVLMLVGVFASTALIFISSPYGDLSQAPRYLLPLYLVFFPLFGAAVSQSYHLSRGLGVSFFAVILGLHLSSAYLHGRAIPGEPFIFREQRVARDHAPLIQRLSELGISHVYTNYWVGYRLAYETQQRVTFTVFGQPSQVRIPSYERQDRWDIPFVLAPLQASILERALAMYHYSFIREEVGGYILLYDLSPKAPLQLRKIKAEELAKVSTNTKGKELSPLNALDGDIKTRWGSGEPQRPGMEFRIVFQEPKHIKAFRYFLGDWEHDYARQFVIKGISQSGTTMTLFSRADFETVCYYRECQVSPHHDFHWPFSYEQERVYVKEYEEPLVEIIIKQIGAHPVLDWSIAELELYVDENGER